MLVSIDFGDKNKWLCHTTAALHPMIRDCDSHAIQSFTISTFFLVFCLNCTKFKINRDKFAVFLSWKKSEVKIYLSSQTETKFVKSTNALLKLNRKNHYSFTARKVESHITSTSTEHSNSVVAVVFVGVVVATSKIKLKIIALCSVYGCARVK